MCLIEFCPLNFLRLIWTLWSICGAWKLHSNTNLLKFFKNRCERLNQSGPRVSDFKTFNHPKAKNSSAPWICCNLLIIISSVTLIIFNWKWKRPVLGMPGTDGLTNNWLQITLLLSTKKSACNIAIFKWCYKPSKYRVILSSHNLKTLMCWFYPNHIFANTEITLKM